MPDWYKNYLNAKRMGMADRPFEYVYYAIKLRPQILEIVTNNNYFTMVNPELFMRKLTDLIGGILKKYKSMKLDEDPD